MVQEREKICEISYGVLKSVVTVLLADIVVLIGILFVGIARIWRKPDRK